MKSAITKSLKLTVAMLVLTAMSHAPSAIAQTKPLPGNIQPLSVKIPKKATFNNANPVEARLERGFQRLDKGDYKGAVLDFNYVIRSQPKHPYAYFGRGLALLQLGDSANANKDFDTSIQLEPSFPYAYYFRAATRYALNDKQGAIADLQTAAKLAREQNIPELAQQAQKAIDQIS